MGSVSVDMQKEYIRYGFNSFSKNLQAFKKELERQRKIHRERFKKTEKNIKSSIRKTDGII